MNSKKNSSNNLMSLSDITSIQDFIDNPNLVLDFANLCATDNEYQIAIPLKNMLFDKFKKVDNLIFQLHELRMIWKKNKNEKVLINEVGKIFNEIISLYPKNLKFDSKEAIEEDTKRKKALAKFTKSGKIKSVLEFVSSQLAPIDEDEFINGLDASPYELPIKNCKVLNLKHKIVRPRGKPSTIINQLDLKLAKPFLKDNDYFTFEIDNELTKDVKIADDFFKSLMCGCKIKTKYLQQVLGSCLINGNPSQSFFIFTGEGSNGKSTLIKIMDYFLGKVSSSIDPNLIIENSKNKYSSGSVANPHIVKLRNKRFIFLSETSQNDKLKESFLKQITGDDKITCRALFSNDVQDFIIGATPVLISNYKPTFDISKQAMLRRFKYIEFNARFVSKPKGKNEYKGNANFWDDVFLPNQDAFFSWLVDGAYSYLNDNIKLEPPKEIKADIEAYINEIDITKQFYNDKLEVSETEKIPKKIMYEEFKLYCEDVGVPYKTKKDFYSQFEKIHKPYKSSGNWYYKNLMFKEDEENDGFQDESDL